MKKRAGKKNLGRTLTDMQVECLRDTAVLDWTSNLPERGGVIINGIEEEKRLVALLARTREALLALRGSVLDHVLEEWSADEIRQAREP